MSFSQGASHLFLDYGLGYITLLVIWTHPYKGTIVDRLPGNLADSSHLCDILKRAVEELSSLSSLPQSEEITADSNS
jgi:hypothetical protein